jgi:CspA family cold shock protein
MWPVLGRQPTVVAGSQVFRLPHKLPDLPIGRDTTMATGAIVRLVRDRGFGFIKTDKGSDLFFHSSGVTTGTYDELREDQQVTYDMEPDSRGRGNRAVNVKPA